MKEALENCYASLNPNPCFFLSLFPSLVEKKIPKGFHCGAYNANIIRELLNIIRPVQQLAQYNLFLWVQWRHTVYKYIASMYKVSDNHCLTGCYNLYWQPKKLKRKLKSWCNLLIGVLVHILSYEQAVLRSGSKLIFKSSLTCLNAEVYEQFLTYDSSV